MARKKIREYDSKRLLKEHLKRLAAIDLQICSAQVTESTDFTELVNKEPWLSSMKLVVKPDMLFGKQGKSGLVALKLDMAQAAQFVKERLGQEVEMGGCKAPITTFIVEKPSLHRLCSSLPMEAVPPTIVRSHGAHHQLFFITVMSSMPLVASPRFMLAPRSLSCYREFGLSQGEICWAMVVARVKQMGNQSGDTEIDVARSQRVNRKEKGKETERSKSV